MSTLPEKHYKREILRHLVRVGDIVKAKVYILDYFKRTYGGCMFLTPTAFHSLRTKEIDNYIPRNMKSFDKYGREEFDALDWYLNENDDIHIGVCEPGKPMTYEEDDMLYFNVAVLTVNQVVYDNFIEEEEVELPLTYQFIKDIYIDVEQPFTDSVKDTYEVYVEYCEMNNHEPLTKIKFGKEVKKLGLQPIAKTVNKEGFKAWNASLEEITAVFKSRGWI